MKSLSLLCLLGLSLGLLSCDKMEAPPFSAAPESGEREESIPVIFQSKDILPGSKEAYFSSTWKNDIPRSIAHDIPSMDKEARGAYSYLGAARVFKSICRFDLPEWVEPIKGVFSVSMRRSGPVRHSTAEYTIDPARRAELEKLIVEATEAETAHRHKLVFVTQPIYGEQSSARFASFEHNPAEKVKERTYILLKDDGTITLRVSRGPVGWDD